MLIIWELFLLFEVKLQDWGWFILQSLNITGIICSVGNLGLPPSVLWQGPQLLTAGLSWQKVRRLHLTEDGSHWWISCLLNEVKAKDLGPFMVLLISLDFTFTDHTTSPGQSFRIYVQLVTEELDQSKWISSRKQGPDIIVCNGIGNVKCVRVGCHLMQYRQHKRRLREVYGAVIPTSALQTRKQIQRN